VDGAADNTEGAYMCHIPRQGSAECQLMRAWLAWPTRTYSMLNFRKRSSHVGESSIYSMNGFFPTVAMAIGNATLRVKFRPSMYKFTKMLL